MKALHVRRIARGIDAPTCQHCVKLRRCLSARHSRRVASSAFPCLLDLPAALPHAWSPPGRGRLGLSFQAAAAASNPEAGGVKTPQAIPFTACIAPQPWGALSQAWSSITHRFKPGAHPSTPDSERSTSRPPVTDSQSRSQEVQTMKRSKGWWSKKHALPPDLVVVAGQQWSWLLLGVGMFALGNWVCHRVLTWERYAEFAPGTVLTMKDHTRKQDVWERLLPRYRVKVGFAAGDGGLQDKRYAFTTDLTPLNRKLFEKVHYDGHAAMLPVLYDEADPTYCRLDDHNHYNLGKVLMYIGVWVAFINAAQLMLTNLQKVRKWASGGGMVFGDRRVVPAPLEVVKQAA